jgi:pyridoxine/pyridoxamine 5'-phosphate oxidase
MFETLDEIRADCANRLIRAARDRKSPMHTPVIVTADVDARVMVLRAFDPASLTLRLHTDTRAPKAQAIAADPRIAAVFYDKGAKIQWRMRPGRQAPISRGAAISATDRARPRRSPRQACRPNSRGWSRTTRSCSPRARTLRCC